jgi:hypothetical protein
MKAHRLNPAWAAALGLLVVAVAQTGCSKSVRALLVPNVRPTISLTNAPVNSADPIYYAYKLNWLGYDPDGRVASFQYCIDPPTVAHADTPWVTTTKNEQIFFFRSSRAESLHTITPRGQDFHVFVIRAVDNLGAVSAPTTRAFYSFTVAPTVQIDNPRPNPLLEPTISPAIVIHWHGEDLDGVFSQKPVKYKFKLFKLGPDIPSDAWFNEPDSLRREFAPDFVGWDSTSAETTFKQYTNLIPQSQYLFVIVAFDEAGAYSPIFSRNSNLLLMNVGFAGNLGPIISLFNDFFFFTYPSGGWSLDPSQAINLEVPAFRPVSFFWFAQPPPGAEMKRYRWAMDIVDLDDESPRSPNERTDTKHWSQWTLNSFGTTVGPFPGRPPGDSLGIEQHDFYLEAEDINGLQSLGWIHFNVIRASFDKELLIVDDTRMNEDHKSFPISLASPDSMLAPLGLWPTAAELDTFLYAKGGVRWRSTPDGTQSTPGLFHGYAFDTIGTRTGAEDPTLKLAYLGQYKYIVWMVDGVSSQNKQGERGGPPNSPIFPMTTLRYMTEPNRQNTLASWISQGGKLWLCGGGIGNATMSTYNNRTNDINQTRIYTSAGTRPELVSGRFMYDAAHWRSEFKPFYGGKQKIRRIDQPDPRYDPSDPNSAYWPGGSSHTRELRPEYNDAPAEMLPKTAATDPLPPNRNATDVYINVPTSSNGIDLEFLTAPNSILLDPDGEPETGDESSVLDTLYVSPGQYSAMNRYEVNQLLNPTMTIYRGTDSPNPVVFTGFNIWNFRRQDCQALVDFVLNDVWNFHRAPPPPISARPAAAVRRPVASRHP